MRLFFGNALWHLIEQSDFMIKIILLGLFVVSIACWALIFYKIMLFNLQAKQLRAVSQRMRRLTNRHDLTQLVTEEAKTFPGALLVEYTHELQTLVQKKGRLTDRDAEILDMQRMTVVEELVYQNEEYLSTLSVAAAAGPLIGLFGTVWGLTHSFISISEKQSADIVTIAPGMAEALMTTMAGLMVAIPMLIMFHYLSGRVRAIEHALHQLSDQLHANVQRIFIETEEKHENPIFPNETPKRPFVS